SVGLYLDRRPLPSVRRKAIGGDGRSEVIPHGVSVRHVDRFPPPDRQERPETEAGHTFHIAFRIAAGELVEKRIDRGGHERTLAAVAAPVNLVSRVAARRCAARIVGDALDWSCARAAGWALALGGGTSAVAADRRRG